MFSSPEAGSHPQQTQKLEEIKENAQDTVRQINKKSFWSYGENKPGFTAVLIHIQKSSVKMPRKLADVNSFNIGFIYTYLMIGSKS